MLFPVKRLPSIASADQYLVSSPPNTEASAADASGYPLLLKYHNIGDNNYCLLEDCPSDSVVTASSEGSKFYLSLPETNGFSNFSDVNTLSKGPEIIKENGSFQQGLVGLYNLENTCFLNSIVQCLRFTKPLFVYIFRDEYVDELHGTYPDLVEEFALLVKNLWTYSHVPSAITPRPFTKAVHHFAPEFDGFTQQDAHEFLLCILTGLHENLNLAPLRQPVKTSTEDSLQGHTMWQKYLNSDNSRIIKIFVGQLRSMLMCTHCNNMSTTFDPFWDLSLPVPSCTGGSVSIEQCLSACLNDERIDGANMPFCNKCNSHKPCQKQLDIYKLPKILVLHLKRFTDDQEKLNTMVKFPVKCLDLEAFCSGNICSGAAKYDLYAVVNHTGSMTYGHYTAFCRNPIVNEWFEFNDHHVSHLDSAESVVTDKAYILFYELRGKSSKL